MKPDRPTQKSRAGLHRARTATIPMGHGEVDNDQLLALLDRPAGRVAPGEEGPVVTVDPADVEAVAW